MSNQNAAFQYQPRDSMGHMGPDPPPTVAHFFLLLGGLPLQFFRTALLVTGTQLFQGCLGSHHQSPPIHHCQCPIPSTAYCPHLYHLSHDNVPHFHYSSLTAAHDVGVVDLDGQDGVFVFKCLQTLPCVYIPLWKGGERKVRSERGMKAGYRFVPHPITEAKTSGAHQVRPQKALVWPSTPRVSPTTPYACNTELPNHGPLGDPAMLRW